MEYIFEKLNNDNFGKYFDCLLLATKLETVWLTYKSIAGFKIDGVAQ